MTALLRSIFGKMPKPGQRFYFDRRGNPFENSFVVEVTAVRGNWVQYGYADRAKYGESLTSTSIGSFNFCFKPTSNV